MYTKGEWIVHEWGNKFQVMEAQVRTTSKPEITMTGQRIIAKEITKANAHLISAAPDLYEACLSALGVMATLDQNKGWVKEISSVIQKALAKVEGK